MNEKELNIYYIGSNSLFQNTTIKNSTIQECYNYLKDKKIISLDIETTRKFNGKYGKIEGLDPYTSKIVMLQIGDEKKQFVIDYRVIDIDILNEILINNSIIKVGHNIKFEYLHILHNQGIRINNLYDTMIVEQILYNGLELKNGLKDLNKRYLNIEVDKSTRLEFLNIGSKEFTTKQIIYGAEDILYPLLIRNKQLEEIEKANLGRCVSLEMLFLEVLGDIEYKGINFNKEIWLETYNKNLKEFELAEEKLNQFVINNYFDSNFVSKQLNLFSNTFNCSIMWTSSKQVIEFFNYLNICPKEVSKTTNKLSYTVIAKVVQSSLNTINKDISDNLKQFIKDYLKFKELEQTCTTFGKDFLKYINPISKRIHSNYKQILNTGRISSSKPNLQNIPAKEEFRKAFDAPNNFKIVNSDYSGQENICLANSSLDPDILNFYRQGLDDMHSYNAQKIFPELKELTLSDIKKQHSDKRQIAKSVSFALAYGGNGFTIANNLGLPIERGEEIYESYFKAFPKLKEFFDKTIKESMSRGYIIIDELTNRRFYFKDWSKLNQYKENKDWKKYFKIKGKYERACLNYIIQGAAGSITKLAAIYYRKWILDNNFQDKIFITNLIHDEINVESLEELSEIAANNLEICMQESGKKWCKTIPLKAEAVITNYWNH